MTDVIVVGGGVAGCSVAARLAAEGLDVVVLERGNYPAHKLCGEFLSTEVRRVLPSIGVSESLEAVGAQPIHRVTATAATGATYEGCLPGTAYGLSRYVLDALLANAAQARGAEVREGMTVRDIRGGLDRGFEVDTTAGTWRARLVIGAYGKRGIPDRALGRGFFSRPAPLVAFKGHYRGSDLSDVIEIHAFPGGYCGLNRVEGECVNVCWLAEQRVLDRVGGKPDEMIRTALFRNPHLRARLSGMQRVSDRLLAVSQVSLEPKQPVEHDVLMIGDTAGMIAPMCGDGMAMALRAAELVAPLVGSFLAGDLDAEGLRRQHARTWRREFGLRVAVGRAVHRAFIRPGVAHLGLMLAGAIPALGDLVIRSTRG